MIDRRRRTAETCLRWLMRAYPRPFRDGHGLALFELFRDEARDAGQRGTMALTWLGFRTAIDIASNLPSAWLAHWRRPRARATVQTIVGSWVRDLRFAGRNLVHAPLFVLVAVVTLGVSLGVNVTIFSVANAILLRPLASYEPNRVVRIAGQLANGSPTSRFSFSELLELREHARGLGSIAAVNQSGLFLTADGRREELLGEIVSADYLALLGAHVSAGRSLLAADDVPGAAPVAVVSAALWQRRFGRDPATIGRSILLNQSPYTIVGVVDPSFNGSFVGAPVDVWMPIASSGTALGPDWRIDRTRRLFALIARLEPAATVPELQQALQSATMADRETTARSGLAGIHLLPGTLVSGRQRTLASSFLAVLLGLVALVLVVACANVANLLLVRVLGRRREFSIRLALGASRSHLARLLLFESLLLSAASGAAALLFARWATRLFDAIKPLPTVTLRLDTHVDGRVVAFALIATCAAALVVAGAAVLQVASSSIAPALKEESAATSGQGSSGWLRGALVALQTTVSLALVAGAVLLARSVQRAALIDLGLDPRGVVIVDVDHSGRTAPAEARAFFASVLDRIAADASVQAAAVATRAPLDSSTPIARVDGHGPVSAAGDGASPTASFAVVSSRYFEAVGIPIIGGRTFSARDDQLAPAVAIVNETLARRLWPDGSPLGRRLWLDDQASSVPCIVVGVARNSRYVTLGEENQGHVYLPFAQHPRGGMALIIRSIESPPRAIERIQTTLTTIDPAVQGFFARTLNEHTAVALLPVRLASRLAAAVAGLGLLLATVGLYALVAFAVAERTAEIGLRMALGATPGSVMRLVVAYGTRVATIGIVVGVPATLAVARLARALLYDVSPADPVSFGAAAAVVLIVAIAASVVPAARAVRQDPLRALKRTI